MIIPSIDTLKKSLRGHAASAIARIAGVSRPNIIGIREGKIKNPGINTVAAIERAIRQLDRARRGSKKTAKIQQKNSDGVEARK